MTQLHLSATVVADTQIDDSERLISLLLTYPRFIHPQMLRHRSFAHSAQSSRAVSFRRTLQWLEENGPVVPIFTEEQKGMQEGGLIQRPEYYEDNWVSAYEESEAAAIMMERNNLHHSVCNRLLEPFLPIAHLMTGTEAQWQYLLRLRLHEHADVHAQAIAAEIKAAIDASTPEPHSLHLPFREQVEAALTEELGPQNFKQGSVNLWGDHRRIWLSVARCARVSYVNYEKQRPAEQERDFVQKLWDDEHFSPFEHIGMAVHNTDRYHFSFYDKEPDVPQLFGRTWVTLRHWLPVAPPAFSPVKTHNDI